MTDELVTFNDYPRMLEHARLELEQLRRQRAELDERIAKTEQVEAALRAMTEEDDGLPDLSSITDVVRNVLKSAASPMSATEVRDKMVATGFDTEPYSQFLASIHVILKRLWRNGEVFEFSNGDRKTYWWALKGKPGDIVLRPEPAKLTISNQTPAVTIKPAITAGEPRGMAKIKRDSQRKREALLKQMKNK